MHKGGNSACVMNAANEVAVAAFLEDRIPFLRIAEVIEETMRALDLKTNLRFEDFVESDKEARIKASSLI
jgi:1-deoxy-D-xylulose-5-phosphate reductoisomerase